MKKFFLIIFSIILFFYTIQAQDVHQKQFNLGKKQSLSINMPFTDNDMLIGLSLYHPIISQYDISIMGSIYARPFAKKELVKRSSDTYNLYRAYRHYADIGICKIFKIYNDYAVYTALSFGAMAVIRRGSNSDFWELAVPIINIGVCTPNFKSKIINYQFRLGYQYIKTDTYKGNYLNLSLVMLDVF